VSIGFKNLAQIFSEIPVVIGDQDFHATRRRIVNHRTIPSAALGDVQWTWEKVFVSPRSPPRHVLFSLR
jgi:hypothetical protein